MSIKKFNLGQFNTKNDVWLKPQVKNFIYNSKCACGIDPFAGQGDLVKAALDLGIQHVTGYDIDLEINKTHGWQWNDSLEEMPVEEFSTIIITNPPYLAKNSANRNDYENYKYFLKHPEYDDLYQIAILRGLEKCKYAVFIIPETYFHTNFFKEYLVHITILEENPFLDTECPVCVACFEVTNDFYRLENNVYKIYKNELFLFTNVELAEIIERYNPKIEYNIKFNVQEGNIGLRAVDGVDPSDRIRFCRPQELNYDLNDIKESSRAVTVLSIPIEVDRSFLNTANEILEDIRTTTHDVIFSPFKNNNKDGVRRRRLDYGWARKILNLAINLKYGA